jgi:hypothetical protein
MHTAVAAGAHLYVFGGRDDDNSQQTVFHDVHSFCLDPALASAALASPNEQALQSALRRFRQAAASVDRTLCHEEWDAVLDGVERYIAALTLQRDRQRRWAAELLHSALSLAPRRAVRAPPAHGRLAAQGTRRKWSSTWAANASTRH